MKPDFIPTTTPMWPCPLNGARDKYSFFNERGCYFL